MNIMRFSIIFLTVLLTACAPPHKDPESPAAKNEPAELETETTLSEEQVKSAGIVLGKIEPREVSGTIKVNGVLDVPPQNLVSVSAPMGGFVKYTDLLQGMKIKKGQVLATLEGQEYIQLQEDYLASRSQLEFLKLDYERQTELARENVNAAKALQQSRSSYLSMKARAEGLQAKLLLVHLNPADIEKGPIQNTVTVISPSAGYITQVNINIGIHVNPTDVMFRIIDTEHLHAEAQVFEKDITRLKVGQKVRVWLTNDTHERIASVYLIGREVTPDRTVRVHCHFEEEDPNLIPGMYFSATIDVANRPVPALPDEAIVTFEGKKFIFVALGRARFRMQEIKTGSSESGYTEVVPADDLASKAIVIHGAYELLSRLKNSE